MAAVVASKGPEMAVGPEMSVVASKGPEMSVVASKGPEMAVGPEMSVVASKGPEMASLVKKLLSEPMASGALVDADAGDRRLARDFTVPNFFSQDVLDRFGAPTSLLALMGDGLSSAAASAPGRGWSVAKEDGEAVYLKVPMPGLGKEHVKVSAEKNSVVIKGVGKKEPWDGDAPVPRYSRRIELPAGAFKMDKIKAGMKDGVLRVTVPKVKEEERKDVFQVQVE